MRFINPGHACFIKGADWQPLAGPFHTLAEAEEWIDWPPEDLGADFVGTVTIRRDWDGLFYVDHLENEQQIARRRALRAKLQAERRP